jgi:two-component system chemotaxis response regulator CheB
VWLDLKPLLTPHRPSVDVLFQTAAEAFGSGVLAVVLTGMGDDGLAGARAIREVGGTIITEAESTCVVYGMPRCVREAGLADTEVPLDEMAAEILRRI